MNELSVKLNNVRADTNQASNSIANDKVKKLQDDMEDLSQRLNDNEKLTEKITSEITVLRSEINTLEEKIKWCLLDWY